MVPGNFFSKAVFNFAISSSYIIAIVLFYRMIVWTKWRVDIGLDLCLAILGGLKLVLEGVL